MDFGLVTVSLECIIYFDSMVPPPEYTRGFQNFLRISIYVLKPYEEKSNIQVFLCFISARGKKSYT
jgi:hypothetical protein